MICSVLIVFCVLLGLFVTLCFALLVGFLLSISLLSVHFLSLCFCHHVWFLAYCLLCLVLYYLVFIGLCIAVQGLLMCGYSFWSIAVIYVGWYYCFQSDAWVDLRFA